MRTTGVFAFVLTLAGCGAADPVPDEPTWVDDVEPILRGNCFGCHGADPLEGRSRFDICDTDAGKFPELGLKDVSIRAKSQGASILAYLKEQEGTNRPLMPPPPAAPLSQRDLDVIRKWASPKVGAPCGERDGNARPRARLVGQPAMNKNDLVVTFDVTDADGDQVLGKATAGMEVKQLLRSGRHTVVFPNTPKDTPVEVTISDGQALVTVPLVK